MNYSGLILHSTNHQIYCCCYCWEAVVCFTTANNLQFWDILLGKKTSHYDYGQQLAPISINLLSKQHEKSLFLLQDKSGQILIIQYKMATKQFQLLCSYHIQPIGFTRISTQLYVYDGKGKGSKQKSDFFCTIAKASQIQQRSILSGAVNKRLLNKNDNFVDVTALLQFKMQNSTYLLMAEQGNLIKRVDLDHYGKGFQIEDMKRGKVQSTVEIKIILQFEALDDYQAIAVVRQDRLFIIDLKYLTVKMDFMQANFIRRVKELQNGYGMAFSGKKRIGILQPDKKIKSQSINTQLIMDMDVCEWGVVGVTQQGKLLALPFDL